MLSDLAAAATIILAFEAMLCLIIPLALTFAIAYLLFRTNKFLPPRFRLARLQAQRVNDAVNRSGARVTQSLGSAEAKVVQTETLVRNLFGLTKKDQP
jgi:uncharacterized protein (DUF58 family)